MAEYGECLSGPQTCLMEGVSKVHPAPNRRQAHVSWWTKEEHMEALRDNDLFESVEKYLDVGVELEGPAADRQSNLRGSRPYLLVLQILGTIPRLV